MKLTLKSVLRSVLWSHAFGVSLLVLLSCIAMLLSYPSESVRLVGVLSLALGSAFLGLALRGRGASLPDALLGGLLYALPPIVLSLFWAKESVGMGYRLVLIAVILALSVLPSWLFKKKKKYRRIRR